MDRNPDIFELPSICTVEIVENLKDQMIRYLQEPGEEIRCGGREVETIDGAGLQLLLAFYKTALKEGKKFIILEPSSRLQEVFNYSGADKVFAVERSG